VDITFGQENAVASLELFERFDASYIGQNHILKKSILLLKAWFLHDAGRAAGDNRQGNVVTNGRGRGGHAPIYGAKDGGLCTYALNTMVTCLLNTHDIRHPLQAFILFFKARCTIDIHCRQCLTLLRCSFADTAAAAAVCVAGIRRL